MASQSQSDRILYCSTVHPDKAPHTSSVCEMPDEEQRVFKRDKIVCDVFSTHKHSVSNYLYLPLLRLCFRLRTDFTSELHR